MQARVADKKIIQSHFAGRFPDFFRPHVRNLRASANGNMQGTCPLHEDRHPSLSIKTGTGQWKCFGCAKGGDIYTFWAELKNHDVKHDFQKILNEIAVYYKIPLIETRKRESRTITETYPYLAEDGQLLFEVVRYYPKDFKQRRPDGNGNWTWETKDTRKVLYRLPEVQKAYIVWFCEGEKAANAVSKMGFTPTCSPGGAGNWSRHEKDWKISEPLAGKTVIILPDNDEAGQSHALDVAKSLYGRARLVKIVNIPGLPEKGDVYDFIQQHGPEKASDLLGDLATKAPIWRPPKPYITVNELLDMHFPEETPVIDDGILPAGGGMILAGESGVGKSLIRTELAIHLVMGWEWLGLKLPTPRRVLIIQFENTASTEKYRLSRMMKGLQISELPDNLIFSDFTVRFDLSLKKPRETAFKIVEEAHPGVIIWDPMTSLHTANENDNVKIREVLDSITEINRKTRTTSIVIHHYGKPNQELGSSWRARGASSIRDWCDTMIGMELRPHEHKTFISLDFIKIRNGPKKKPLFLERGEDFIHRIADEDMMCPPSRVREILEELGGKVETQAILKTAIMETASCKDRTARNCIKTAIEKMVIREIQDGRKKGYEITK
ncbi:MAG: AAA family ATPase [Deltaproteobacteria bacterium]|nr:AAA family ATPase [Deltaproteobacteria bacterium]